MQHLVLTILHSQARGTNISRLLDLPGVPALPACELEAFAGCCGVRGPYKSANTARPATLGGQIARRRCNSLFHSTCKQTLMWLGDSPS